MFIQLTIINVMWKTNGWTLSASEDMVSKLNNIKYTADNFIFYKSNNNKVAESVNNIENISGNENQACHRRQNILLFGIRVSIVV